MQPEAPDWSRRAEPEELPEWMDEPCTYEDFRACLRDLSQVNRWTFGYRPTLKFLEQLVAKNKPFSPLRILDVGFGGGDALRHIDAWAKKRNVPVELTGIDLNPFAARAAEEWNDERAPIRWLVGDAFSYQQPVDVVLCSLFTHHLPSQEVVRFLAWAEQVAGRGWFVNDLARSPKAARLFEWMARLARWHRFVRHDGPVSFRRSFRSADWQRLLAEAGISSSVCHISSGAPGRLCVARWK